MSVVSSTDTIFDNVAASTKSAYPSDFGDVVFNVVRKDHHPELIVSIHIHHPG
jgi:hypothetical protein